MFLSVRTGNGDWIGRTEERVHRPLYNMKEITGAIVLSAIGMTKKRGRASHDHLS